MILLYCFEIEKYYNYLNFQFANNKQINKFVFQIKKLKHSHNKKSYNTYNMYYQIDLFKKNN